MKILYVGPLNFGGTCLMRANALKELGHDVYGIDTHFYSQFFNYIYNTSRKVNLCIDISRINKKIIKNINSIKFDILWIDKGLIISPKTLKLIKEISPNIKIISYSPDDMMNPENQSKFYLESIPLYDYHISTKSYNVEELKEYGAKKVIFVNNAYDRRIHRPIKVSDNDFQKYSADVGFIGDFEEERFYSMLFLANNNIKVTVRGPNWKRYKNFHPNLIVKPGWVLGEEYSKCIYATKINLCFLRKVNRDLQTTRSIEIPACEGFLLAERTNEHIKLFQEGVEAEFFSNNEELLNKVKFYLNNEKRRIEIAKSGYRRCVESMYSYKDIMDYILEKINNEIL